MLTCTRDLSYGGWFRDQTGVERVIGGRRLPAPIAALVGCSNLPVCIAPHTLFCFGSYTADRGFVWHSVRTRGHGPTAHSPRRLLARPEALEMYSRISKKQSKQRNKRSEKCVLPYIEFQHIRQSGRQYWTRTRGFPAPGGTKLTFSTRTRVCRGRRR